MRKKYCDRKIHKVGISWDEMPEVRKKFNAVSEWRIIVKWLSCLGYVESNQDDGEKGRKEPQSWCKKFMRGEVGRAIFKWLGHMECKQEVDSGVIKQNKSDGGRLHLNKHFFWVSWTTLCISKSRLCVILQGYGMQYYLFRQTTLITWKVCNASNEWALLR